MSRTFKDSRKYPKRPRQISVRGVQRSSPDLRKLARAVVAIAIAQAEAEAQAQVAATDSVPPPAEPTTQPQAKKTTDAPQSDEQPGADDD